MRREEMEVDFLAPFLAQMGDPEKLTKEQILSLKEQCRDDLKQRLVDKANLIQARFEKVRLTMGKGSRRDSVVRALTSGAESSGFNQSLGMGF